MKKITVGIITYMRPIGLEKILLSLKTQSLENIDLSVIVVDNDATGENQKVIDKLNSENYPFKLELYVEKTRGIVAARNRTVSEFLKTDAESMIFVDDDEWPVNSNWIEKLVEVQDNYNCDIVYSDVYILPETDKIEWVKTAYRSNGYGDKIVPTKDFFTNNLLIKREVYEDLHPAFDMRFAMTGSSDMHFCLKANNRGYKAYYTPEAPVEEIFPTSRATLKWFFLRGYRTGEGSTRSNMYESKSLLSLSGYLVYKFAGRFVRAIQMLLKSLFKLDKGYLAKSCNYIGATIGTVTGLFGWKYNEYNKIHGK
jgi:glycosyltransferase involved in cell wall biosynthesis